jgi:hypothetical protein
MPDLFFFFFFFGFGFGIRSRKHGVLDSESGARQHRPREGGPLTQSSPTFPFGNLASYLAIPLAVAHYSR